jgi:hypothetical protein
MISIESVLYGLLGGLVGLKVFLLGLAAVLFVYTMTQRSQQRKMASARTPARPPRLDVHA